MPKIAAAYIRVSTADQLEYSPESQIQLIRDYAKKNDMILPDEYIYRDDGISGRKAEKRPDFMRMIANAKASPPPFEVILIWKFSRFARNQEESIVYKSLLKKQHGIDVVSVSEPLADGPFGSLIERIIEWMDEYYSIRLSGEVLRGMGGRVKSGKHVAAASFGYKVENGELLVDPEKAEIIRMIYADFLSGMSMCGIAKKINNMGVKTQRGNQWMNRNVRYVLTNPVYCGTIRWCPDGINNYYTGQPSDSTMYVDGIHEAIIAPDLFAEVQERLKGYLKMFESSKATRMANQEAGKNGDFMLRGILKCSSCGATMTRVGNGMQCSDYAHGKCHASHSIVMPKINAMVIASLKAALDNFSFSLTQKTSSIETAGEDQIIAAQIKKLNQVLLRYKEAYAAGIDSIDEYKQNKDRTTAEIEALQKKLGTVAKSQAPDKKAFAKHLKENIKILENPDFPEHEKNQLLRSFVDYIVFDKAEQLVDIYFYI